MGRATVCNRELVDLLLELQRIVVGRKLPKGVVNRRRAVAEHPLVPENLLLEPGAIRRVAQDLRKKNYKGTSDPNVGEDIHSIRNAKHILGVCECPQTEDLLQEIGDKLRKDTDNKDQSLWAVRLLKRAKINTLEELVEFVEAGKPRPPK